MSEENSSSRVVEHLETIIKGRYGRDLQIVRLMNFAEMKNQSTQQIGEELHIPLIRDELFLGKAVLKGGDTLQPNDVEKASQTVKLALEPVLYREYLIRQEANQLAQLNQKHMDIRPGFLSVLKEAEVPTFDESLSQLTSQSKKMELTASLLFVEGKSTELVRRVAYEIHDQSQLWSFVQFKDLKSSVKNLTELEELSLATIFIDQDDVQDLAVQNWIYSLKGRKLNDLLIVVHRSEGSFSELTEAPVIPVDRLPSHRLLRIESIQMLLSQACLLK